MNESETLRSAVVKTLAVVGFLATLTLIVFLIITGVRHAPGAFSSLSEIMNKLNSHSANDELTIATDKTVVNSGESFQMTWTDVPLVGEYRFTYSCDSKVSLSVRDAEGELVPMKCTDTLTLTNDATGLFLSPTSEEMRFSDVELTIAFEDTEKTTALVRTAKVTVVNAGVAFREEDEDSETDAKGEVATTPVKKETGAPITPRASSPYPASDPQGYTDLTMTILGSGVLHKGTFVTTRVYDYNQNNALRFDVKNVGTKRSGTWNFSVVLPNGEVYTSATQIALGPQEHIEFTLGFFVNREDGSTVTLTPTLYAASDTNAGNNSASVTVAVE